MIIFIFNNINITLINMKSILEYTQVTDIKDIKKQMIQFQNI